MLFIINPRNFLLLKSKNIFWNSHENIFEKILGFANEIVFRLEKFLEFTNENVFGFKIFLG